MKNIRILTSTSLFDGHDASINIMRRVLQEKGVEIIHLGHNRSALEIVTAAIEEDVHGIAITSYQGGHMEFFSYLRTLLNENGYHHIKIVGGGGGTILPKEALALEKIGISKIYLPEDGLKLGIDGMIDEVVRICSYELKKLDTKKLPILSFEKKIDPRNLSRQITLLQNNGIQKTKKKISKNIPIIGLTGTGGAGKSTVCDKLIQYFIMTNPDKTIAIVSIDPSKRKTGGALLGDRIRMNAINHSNVFMRSLATRTDKSSIADSIDNVIELCKLEGFDAIIIETAGVGQNDSSIVDHVTIPIYVMTPEFGAPTQLEKINMIDYANIIAINKFDRIGGLDAIIDVRKQFRRSRHSWDADASTMPIFGTIASNYNDPGIQAMYNCLVDIVKEQHQINWNKIEWSFEYDPSKTPPSLLSNNRKNYLGEAVEVIRKNNQWIAEQKTLASKWYCFQEVLKEPNLSKEKKLIEANKLIEQKVDDQVKSIIKEWPIISSAYQQNSLEYEINGKKIKQVLNFETQSGTLIQKVQLPKFKDWGDITEWHFKEHLPGFFPFTNGVFKFKQGNEDPTRMFAGEGCPERTNLRFHFLSKGQSAIRLSTAFDSVTLYGHDPEKRLDVFGKIGNAGVNIATIDDIKKLYSGLDLNSKSTSVSMTINGPAPILMAQFFNAAIDQACEKYITENKLWPQVNKKIKQLFKDEKRPEYINLTNDKSLDEWHNGLGLKLLGISGDQVLSFEVYEEIKKNVLSTVRGTLQADILKEDQAQNTCIFSTEFALKLMGDVQTYFAENKVRHFYSISISGYHIAEAGANPITQLAFTLANGFTYVEYFINRGIAIDDFCHNLSFFFSNGMDPEYAVIGRVARRIWSRVLKYKYNANDRSQKLKYHIQTSGRSLHAQEINFNDIRTTLQALYAIYDQCNSLHTNAYDEAITTPTEESVRRALAIQLIINKELGTTKVENFQQGSFLITELTDLVEEAVLVEFDRINQRGGVLGAMERMYQRTKIQEESLNYETKKHNGEIPIIGVNSFLNMAEDKNIDEQPIFRSSNTEQNLQIKHVEFFKKRNKDKVDIYLNKLQQAAIKNENIFTILMEAVKYCSLGQISNALYQIGGKYSRNL
jgi:methylmalonyl-CoA mutase